MVSLIAGMCISLPLTLFPRMADNGHGKANDYDRGSFKTILKDTKRAFEEGFDIGIVPDGQLNPTPEQGLLPVFSGAFPLAKMSRRPIHIMAHYGIHNLWPTQRMECLLFRWTLK